MQQTMADSDMEALLKVWGFGADDMVREMSRRDPYSLHCAGPTAWMLYRPEPKQTKRVRVVRGSEQYIAALNTLIARVAR